MADSSASEFEESGREINLSNESSIESPLSSEKQLHNRIESLQQQNKVLKCEVDTYKIRVNALLAENRNLRQNSVSIQAKAEQEEEFISNTLLKKIQILKKEKETLALNYEQEEECLTNDLSRKLNQLRQEKVQLEMSLEQEQECLVNKLMRRIEKLETETSCKQNNLEILRREKVELENTLEQEQEAFVNKLWKRMDKLETEKRCLQVKLDQPLSEPQSPKNSEDIEGKTNGEHLMNNIHALKAECAKLKRLLLVGKREHERKKAEFAREEKEVKEENLRLTRRLQLEVERREALCRHLSESESSLEIEEERVYNEMSQSALLPQRSRTISSPVPMYSGISPGSSRPLSPGYNFGSSREPPLSSVGFSPLSSPLSSLSRLHHGIIAPSGGILCPSPPPPPPGSLPPTIRRQQTTERFVKPSNPVNNRCDTPTTSRYNSESMETDDIASFINKST